MKLRIKEVENIRGNWLIDAEGSWFFIEICVPVTKKSGLLWNRKTETVENWEQLYEWRMHKDKYSWAGKTMDKGQYTDYGSISFQFRPRIYPIAVGFDNINSANTFIQNFINENEEKERKVIIHDENFTK